MEYSIQFFGISSTRLTAIYDYSTFVRTEYIDQSTMTVFTNLKIRSWSPRASCINRAANYARATHLNASVRRRCCKINYKAHSAESWKAGKHGTTASSLCA